MLLHLLEHKYSKTNLNAGALKGKDAHKASILHSLAEELGFSLGLVHLESYKTGSVINDHSGRIGRSGTWVRGEKPGKDHHLLDVEEYKKEWHIQHLVDLDGSLIQEKIDEGIFDKAIGLTIPEDIRSLVEEGGVDESKYGGYQGNVSNSGWPSNILLTDIPKAWR